MDRPRPPVTLFLGLTRAIFHNYEDAFCQHQDSLLDDVAFEVWKRTAVFNSETCRGGWPGRD